MFRDGFLTDSKRYRKHKGRPEIPKKVMRFSELVSLLDIISLTGDKAYLQHIDDPFALMLLFGVYVKVDLPQGFLPSEALRNDFSCEEIWDLVHDSGTDWGPVLMALRRNEQFYLQEIVSLRSVEGVSARDIIREFSKIRAFDFEDTYRAWCLQPDPQAMSYAIFSTYTLKSPWGNPGFQRVTPALGAPIHLMYPEGRLDQVRFPCVAFEVPEGERVQLHKDCDDVRVFDSRHNLVGLSGGCDYSVIPHSGVFDGFWDNGTFWAWDVVQLNDVWLYNDELAQRVRYLWRLGQFSARMHYCFNWDEVERFQELGLGPVVLKNLNSVYDPALRGAWIDFSAGKVVQLKVSRVHRGADTVWTLMTEDGVSLFQFGGQNVGLSNKDRVVEVNRSGEIVRHRPDLGFAQSWLEVQSVFGISEPGDLVPEDSEDWIRKSLWRKLSKEQGFK